MWEADDLHSALSVVAVPRDHQSALSAPPRQTCVRVHAFEKRDSRACFLVGNALCVVDMTGLASADDCVKVSRTADSDASLCEVVGLPERRLRLVGDDSVSVLRECGGYHFLPCPLVVTLDVVETMHAEEHSESRVHLRIVGAQARRSIVQEVAPFVSTSKESAPVSRRRCLVPRQLADLCLSVGPSVCSRSTFAAVL